MHELIDRFEARELSATEVENAIESHVQALEGIDLKAIHEARHLCYRLVVSDLTEIERELVDGEEVSTVLKAFRHFLDSLSV
jgi:hypothetical protein